ncbi:MAG: LemA family protein [Candidatus Omnitrophica bacterium]|nr:LemA family protein [Candidatus Omnitrophota bacterium]
MKKGLLIALAVIVGIGFMIGSFWGGSYNRLVSGEEAVSSAWAQVQNVYQRRLDLIPNLVETVKGYAAHEKETLEGVVAARSKATSIQAGAEIVNNPELLKKFQQSQGELSSAISRLMIVVEKYPDLKANQNFLTLQTQLEGTENRITVERMRFNEAAQTFNTLRRQFPTVFIAKLMGFSSKAYFQAEEGAQKAPQVKF